MADTGLLKIRLAFADKRLRGRVAAAQMMHIAKSTYVHGSPEAILASVIQKDPETPRVEILAEVLVDPAVQSAITMNASFDVVTDEVTDAQIQGIVDAEWTNVARMLFPQVQA